MRVLTDAELDLAEKHKIYLTGKWLFLALSVFFLVMSIKFHLSHNGEQNETLTALAGFQACLTCFFIYKSITTKLNYIHLIQRLKESEHG